MIIPPTTQWTVSTDGSFTLQEASCTPPAGAPVGKAARRALADQVEQLDDLPAIDQRLQCIQRFLLPVVHMGHCFQGCADLLTLSPDSGRAFLCFAYGIQACL